MMWKWAAAFSKDLKWAVTLLPCTALGWLWLCCLLLPVDFQTGQPSLGLLMHSSRRGLQRQLAPRLTFALQDKLSNSHQLFCSSGSSPNVFKLTAHLTVLFAIWKAGSYFNMASLLFPPTLLLPPEEDNAATQHSNPQCWKWPVQDNWKGIWAITGILISDSSRKELNSFLLVLLGLMFDRKWVWRVQEQVTELSLLPAALPTLTVCLQKSDTLAYY